MAPVNAPSRTGGPHASWPHRVLYDRVIDALHATPSRLRTSLWTAGISATDLFTLNTPLGAAIESSVVEYLTTDFIMTLPQESVSGIRARHWQSFARKPKSLAFPPMD